MDTGPLLGLPIDEEIETTGPVIAETFVTMEEAQAALRALSDAGLPAEIVNRDDQFPMTISRFEPAFGLSVAPVDSPRAREILKSKGLLPVAVARFRREEDAKAALSALEAKGIRGRISTLVLDEIPEEFRDDMEPYMIEVPTEQDADAMAALEAFGIVNCDVCGAQIQKGDLSCRTCGQAVAV